MSSFVAIKRDTFGVSQTPFRPPIRIAQRDFQ
jgi:hypothetical protein